VNQGSELLWCDTTTEIVGVDNLPNLGTQDNQWGPKDSHSGAENTVLIAADCSISAAGVAANYELDGVDGWFLPNKEELNLLYLQRSVVGGFSGVIGAYYWSSSESDDPRRVWAHRFVDIPASSSIRYTVLKDSHPNRVRAIRAF
jgi:hypothetical protein